MATNLLEAYAKRLAISEQVYAKAHMNESMSKAKKLATAKCLENINRFMNEAFSNSVGTQRADVGNYKKFTLNLVTVALPNLIAYDLVIVQPMSSFSGYITYVEYTNGSNKGKSKQGDVLNSPFKLGDVDTNYTSQKVVEAKPAAADNVAAGKINWTPILPGTVEFIIGGVAYRDNGEGKIIDAEGAEVSGATIDYATGEYSIAATTGDTVMVNYAYDNVVIPQNDLPILNAQVKSIGLTAKARRIAIYYSQIAAFQAKNDYGLDLSDQLAEKAVGQLSYEIDTEITDLLIANASQDGDLVWSKTLPLGVSKQDHYAAFTEILEIAKQKIYDRTKRFSPNYILVASNLMPILSFVKDFRAAPTGTINGPYFAGTVGSLKVFVTPNIEQGRFVVGVNGDDLMSSAAVYAPYVPVIPTELLGFADGAMSEGFSTLYDLKLLNANLLVAGRVTA